MNLTTLETTTAQTDGTGFHPALRAVLRYFGFMWGVSWRSLVLSLLMAVILGVVLGVLSNSGFMASDDLTPLANVIAGPMTIATVVGVIIIRCRTVFA